MQPWCLTTCLLRVFVPHVLRTYVIAALAVIFYVSKFPRMLLPRSGELPGLQSPGVTRSAGLGVVPVAPVVSLHHGLAQPCPDLLLKWLQRIPSCTGSQETLPSVHLSGLVLTCESLTCEVRDSVQR